MLENFKMCKGTQDCQNNESAILKGNNKNMKKTLRFIKYIHVQREAKSNYMLETEKYL